MDKKKIVALYMQGMTYQEIADKVGCSTGTVWRAVKYMNPHQARQMSLESIEMHIKTLRTHIREACHRARNINTYCEWSAKYTVRLMWNQYRALQEMRRYQKRKAGPEGPA